MTHLEMCKKPLDDVDNAHNRHEELIKAIGDDVAAIISGVIKAYDKFDGEQTVEITHGNHTPWKKHTSVDATMSQAQTSYAIFTRV